MKRKIQLLTSILSITLCGASLHAMYWDIDGATPGPGGANPDGAWTAANWSTDSTGSSGTTTFDPTKQAYFCAGTDATGTYTISGTATAAGINVEEGNMILTGTITIGAGPVNISSGASLSINSSARIAATAGSVITLNGGKLEDTNTGNAGSFVDVDQTIVLGTGGGTISYTTTGGFLNIIQTTTTITGTGPLTKTGGGIIAVASACTYSGSTIINDGTLRCRTSSNRLPTGTAVILNSPGVLDPGVSTTTFQRVASIEGNGNIVFAASGNLIINQTGTKTFSGVISDGAAFGRMTKQAAGTLVLEGANDFDGRWTNATGVITVTSTGSLIGAGGDVYLNSGTINLNNDAQSIENLSGNAGATLNLNGNGSGHTFSMTLGFDSTFAGLIAGVGGVTVNGPGWTETLGGNNTYSGPTQVGSGTLKITGSPTGAGATTVNGGRLQCVTGGSLANSAVTVAGFATNKVQVITAGGTFTIAATTLNADSRLEFDFGTTGTPSTTTAPLQVTGNVDFSGQPVVNLLPSTLALPAGTYPVMTWSGSMSGTFADAPLTCLGPQVVATVKVVGNSLVVVVTSNLEPLKWATTSGTWDTTTANWVNAAPASAVYTEAGSPPVGDQVVFEDTQSGASPITVTVGSMFAPVNVIADNTTKEYTLSGGGWITGGTMLTKKGSNKLTLATAFPQDYTGGTDLQGGRLQLGDGTTDCKVAGDITTAASTVVGVSNVSALSLGNISGGGAFIKGGAGTLTLASGLTTTMSGGQSVYDGTLTFASVNNSMTGPVLADGPNARILLPSSGYIGSTAVGAGDVTLDNGGKFENVAINSSATTFLTANRSLKIGAGGGQVNTGGAALGDTILLYAGGVIAGVTPGVGTLTYNGPCEVRTYDAHNSFGKLIVNGGMFTAGHAVSSPYNDSYGAIPSVVTPDAITILNGAALRLAGGLPVTLDAKQGITMGAGGGVIRAVPGQVGAGILTIPGVITGGGALQLNSAADNGVITLSGANDCSGGMTLIKGTLNINNATALGAAAGTLTINRWLTNAVTINNTSGGAIALVNNNPQSWWANFTFTGANDLNLGAGAVALNASITLTTTTAGKTLTVGGAISGTGFAITKAGAGTLALAGAAANTYDSGTTVNAGTLDIQKDGGLGSGNVTVASGATLKLGSGTANTYINSAATLTLNGASPSVNLAFTGTPNTIAALYFGATQMPYGTWGGPGSGADNVSTFFSGTGKLNVTGPGPATPANPAITIILDQFNIGGGNVDLKLQGTPTATYRLLSSPDVAAPLSSWLPVANSTTSAPPSGEWHFTVNAAAPQYYRLISP